MNMSSVFQRPSKAFALTTLTLGGLLGLYGYEFFLPTIQIDDAYISYRYAQNLVDGHGLVYNIGERVEGYTNLLWTLMVAAGITLGLSASLVGHWLGLVSGVFLLLACYVYSRSLLPKKMKWLALAAPMLLYASNSFAAWVISGLEAPLFAAWVTAALAAFTFRRIGWVLVFCILASLTRPEGALLAALLLGVDWLAQLIALRPKRLMEVLRLSLPCLAYGLFIAGLSMFRVVYYGDVLPNTFYAKTGGIPLSAGPAYLYRFLIDGAIFLLIPALVALRCKAYRIGFAFLTLIAVYLIVVGGDVFFHGRFLLPVLPILIAGALVGIAEIGKASTKIGLLAGLTLPAFVLCSLYSLWPRNTDFAETLEVVRALPLSAKRESVKVPSLPLSEPFFEAQVAKLRQLEPPAKLVAAIGIGQMGYFGREMIILDLVGLTDRHIARSDKRVEGALLIPGHQKSDASYVLSRRPDVIYIPKLGEAALLPTVVSLHREPRLSQEYLWDEQLAAYVRRAELRRLP
jgi:arabinofuranosyltransferase